MSRSYRHLTHLTLLLFLTTTILAWCPRGQWEDQNGWCHPNSSPPPGWRPINNNQDLVRDNTFRNGNGPYTRYNHPSIFFNGQGNNWLRPRRVPILDIDWSMAKNVRTAHGVFAAIAFVALFPLGAISAAILPGKVGVGVHVALQMLGFVVYLVAFGMGIWMATVIRWNGFDLYQHYHPILGILIFLVIFLQPISGALHHVGFRKHSSRGFAGYFHAWMGRIFITLGIINGGLGLHIAGNANGGQIMAYALIAAGVWIAWMLASVFGTIRRHRRDVPSKHSRRRGRGEVVETTTTTRY